jgi:FkbM family methyltransferase
VGVASTVMSRVPTRLLVPAIAWQYRWNERELNLIDSFVPIDRGAVDIGMWWGPWTWWLARRVPRVDAFEPNAELVERVRTVMPANVSVHGVALSDRAGTSEMWITARGAGTEGRGSLEVGQGKVNLRSVETSRLDDLDLGDVGFVKIDVEGHELAVLSGATKLLDVQRPNVLVEVEPQDGDLGNLDTVIKFFADHSYSGQYFHKGGWHPIEELDRAHVCAIARRVAGHGYITNNLLWARRYVHNFVFKPS